MAETVGDVSNEQGEQVMGYAEINLNPEQFGTADGGPSHVAPGAPVRKKYTRSDRELKQHIFDAHTRSTDAGKIGMNPPEGHTFKNGMEWHDHLHATGAFEWRNEHTHE
jgi:hypothetical protein